MTATADGADPLRVLIAGGGIAGTEAALALHHTAGDGVAIELLTPGTDLVDRPGSVRAPFADFDLPRLPLKSIAAFAGITVHRGSLAAVDVGRRQATTRDGTRLAYDRLIVAVGAHATDSVAGAVHFRGPLTAGALEATVRAAAEDPDAQLTFALSSRVSWPLPLYEIALLAAADLTARGVVDPRVCIVTHEQRPLELLGAAGSEATARLLRRAGVEVVTGADPRATFDGVLQSATGALLKAGRVVTLPALAGRPVDGLPHDADGFVAIDEDGRVPGAPDVFAVGDATDRAIKQGGLAAQQADVVAAQIAAEVGARIEASAPMPVLRAVFATPDGPLYIRMALDGARHATLSPTPLWDPPTKVAARFLSGFFVGRPGAQLVEPNPVA
jgi:sulfide:quinone oxidoreductase